MDERTRNSALASRSFSYRQPNRLIQVNWRGCFFTYKTIANKQNYIEHKLALFLISKNLLEEEADAYAKAQPGPVILVGRLECLTSDYFEKYKEYLKKTDVSSLCTNMYDLYSKVGDKENAREMLDQAKEFAG